MSPGRSGRAAIGACVLAVIAASGGACEGEPETATVNRDTSGAGLGQLKAFSFRERGTAPWVAAVACSAAVLLSIALAVASAVLSDRKPMR